GSRHPDGRRQPAPSSRWSCSAPDTGTRRGHCPGHRRRKARPGGGAWQPDHVATARRSSRSRSEEHTSELQSRENLVCRLLLEKKKKEQIEHVKSQTRKTKS